MLITTRDLLLEDSDIAGEFGQRIYPDQLDDAATFPAMVLTDVSGRPEYTMQGDTGVQDGRLQVDVYTDAGWAEMDRLRWLVRRKLSGFAGGPSGEPCAIQGAFVINDLDLSEPATERAGPRLRRRMLEFRIWTREL